MALTTGRWFFFFLLIPFSAFAEKGVAFKQSLLILPHETVGKLLPASIDKNELRAVAEFVMKLSYNDLPNKLAKDSLQFQNPETSIFLSGGKSRMDMQSPIGRQSMIYDKSAGVLFDIFWAQKKYLQVNVAELKKQRAAVLSELNQNSESHPGSSQVKPKAHFKKTAKKKKIAGIQCRKFVFQDSSKYHVVWASMRKTKTLKQLLAFYLDIRNDVDARGGDEPDIWHDFPEAIPLASLKIVRAPGQGLVVEISRIDSMNFQTFMPDFFQTPEDFTRGDIFDTLQLDRSAPTRRQP